MTELTRMDTTVVVVMPVLDDWASMAKLIADLEAVAAQGGERFAYIAVDDGSASAFDPEQHPVPPSAALQVVRLAANQGHQRAIALGLAHVERVAPHLPVLVLDSDGEDRPSDALRLVQAGRANPDSVVCARRAKRSENFTFRFFYGIYRAIFQFLTGREIRFGNFSYIPAARLKNVLYNQGVWNNLAATLLRSRVPMVYVDTDRGVRYFGQSKMNFVGLMLHGLSVISVFSDVAIGRIVLLLTVLLGVLSAAIAVVLGVKLTTDVFVPGYATTVILFLANMLVSSLFIGFGVILLLLNARSASAALPATLYDSLVREVVTPPTLRAAAE